MIKLLKIQKGLWIIFLGVLALIAYYYLSAQESAHSKYALGIAGALFILGSLLLIYPILSAKKDKDGVVNLNKEATKPAEHPATDASNNPS